MIPILGVLIYILIGIIVNLLVFMFNDGKDMIDGCKYDMGYWFVGIITYPLLFIWFGFKNITYYNDRKKFIDRRMDQIIKHESNIDYIFNDLKNIHEENLTLKNRIAAVERKLKIKEHK